MNQKIKSQIYLLIFVWIVGMWGHEKSLFSCSIRWSTGYNRICRIGWSSINFFRLITQRFSILKIWFCVIGHLRIFWVNSISVLFFQLITLSFIVRVCTIFSTLFLSIDYKKIKNRNIISFISTVVFQIAFIRVLINSKIWSSIHITAVFTHDDKTDLHQSLKQVTGKYVYTYQMWYDLRLIVPIDI